MKQLLKNRDALLAAFIVVVALIIGSVADGFLNLGNLVAVYNDTAILIILAMGQMLVILTRSIDLSVAANLALSGMVVALLNSHFPELPVLLIVLVGVLCGLVMGLINGLLVWKLGIPAIVVTLGTMSIYRGIVFLMSNGEWVNAHEMTPEFIDLPAASFLGLSLMTWLSLVIIAGFFYLLRFRELGRQFFSAGNNPTAAFYIGVNVGKVQFVSFAISGALAGLAGYLWVARYAVAYVDVANGFELQVIAACVIGGVSIMGGIGSLFGCILGALFIGLVNNALPVIGVSPFWQMAISGGVIILAVIANSKAEKKPGRIILKTTN